MTGRARTRFAGIALVVISACGPAIAQERKITGTPRPGVKERVAAIERLMETRTDDSIKKFVDEEFAPTLRSSKTPSQWMAKDIECSLFDGGFQTFVWRLDRHLRPAVLRHGTPKSPTKRTGQKK